MLPTLRRHRHLTTVADRHPNERNHQAMDPIELHLVHSAAPRPQTRLLVVAVFMGIPSANPDDGKILAELVDNVDQSIDVDATKLLPNARPYFAYQGRSRLLPAPRT